jgi:hypothetical protein
VHPGQQLVDDLDRAALARLAADPVDLAGHRIQHRGQLVEGGVGAAAITVISPASALMAPPETGASSIGNPISASSAARALASSAAMVEETMMAVPGLRWRASPASPSRMRRTWVALTTSNSTASSVSARAWHRP